MPVYCFLVRQNQFDKLCNSERGWAFERVINGALEGYDHKKLEAIETRGECARLCLLVKIDSNFSTFNLTIPIRIYREIVISKI